VGPQTARQTGSQRRRDVTITANQMPASDWPQLCRTWFNAGVSCLTDPRDCTVSVPSRAAGMDGSRSLHASDSITDLRGRSRSVSGRYAKKRTTGPAPASGHHPGPPDHPPPPARGQLARPSTLSGQETPALTRVRHSCGQADARIRLAGCDTSWCLRDPVFRAHCDPQSSLEACRRAPIPPSGGPRQPAP